MLLLVLTEEKGKGEKEVRREKKEGWGEEMWGLTSPPRPQGRTASCTRRILRMLLQVLTGEKGKVRRKKTGLIVATAHRGSGSHPCTRGRAEPCTLRILTDAFTGAHGGKGESEKEVRGEGITS